MSAKVPGSECSRANSLRGMKVPGSELARVLLADSLQGANWPGSEKAVNQNYYSKLGTLKVGPYLPELSGLYINLCLLKFAKN